MSNSQTTFIEKWVDDNSERLSEISGKNQQLYDAVFNVLDYINNFYGGAKISQPIIQTPEQAIIEIEQATTTEILEDLSMTKLILPNLEERIMAYDYLTAKGYTWNPLSKPQEELCWYIGDNKQISTETNITDFINSTPLYRRVYLQEIGVLPPFVEVEMFFQRSKIKVNSFEEAKELLEILRQMKLVSYRPFATINSTTSFNTLARHKFFYFTWQQGWDAFLGNQPIDFYTDEIDFENSTFPEISLLQIKQKFEEAKAKQVMPITKKPKKTKKKLIPLQHTTSIPVQNTSNKEEDFDDLVDELNNLEL